jgi:hypothetical protein
VLCGRSTADSSNEFDNVLPIVRPVEQLSRENKRLALLLDAFQRRAKIGKLPFDAVFANALREQCLQWSRRTVVSVGKVLA